MKTLVTAALLVTAFSGGVSADGVGTYGFPDDPKGVQSRDGVCASAEVAKSGLEQAGLHLMLTFTQDDGLEEMNVYRDADSYLMVTVWSDGLWCMTGSYEKMDQGERYK